LLTLQAWTVALDTAGDCRWTRSFWSGGIRGTAIPEITPEVERKQMLSDLLGENDVGLPSSIPSI
jgi:hypothetical protein